MKILFVGDAVVSSGFARCTHAAADAMHAAGHEVAVLGINFFGDPHPYPYPIYPCHQPNDGGTDNFGVTRLPLMIDKLRPDIVVLVQDPWNIPAYLDYLKYFDALDCKPMIVGWLAVDGKNQHANRLNDLSHVVVWTTFAANELKAGGYMGEPSIVPLGVDPVFYPRDRYMSRVKMIPQGYPDDIFIVGAVGRNQYRKRLDLTLSYFSEWIKRCEVPDAYLAMHIAPTGDQGCNLRSLIKYYGLSGKVLLSEPNISSGLDDDAMAHLYSSFDVYLTTTQGEGWGLPTLEAMACGVPCIVPDWSGLGSWVGDAAIRVACTSTALTAPANALMHTIGGVPDRATLINDLNSLHKSEVARRSYSQRGLRLAKTFTWERTGREFCTVMEKLIEDHIVAEPTSADGVQFGDV